MVDVDLNAKPTVQFPKWSERSISNLVESLLKALVQRAEQEDYGKTALEKIEYTLIDRTKSEAVLKGVTVLTAYMAARASERQAKALEDLVSHVKVRRIVDEGDEVARAIIDERESKRDYLATTYSLPTETLSLLWAMRGIVMDASVRSLSRPDRFDPYRHVSTEDMAWTLRLSPEDFWARLPRRDDGVIDYDLIEEFDVVHYGGTDEAPDDWMYRG